MWRRILLVLLIANAVAAFAGMTGLINNGLGLGEEMLDGTPFESYLLPGLLLGAGVGLTHVVAAVLVWRLMPYAALASMASAFALAIWMFVQVSLIGGGFALQWIFFALAMIEIGVIAAWLGLFQSVAPQSSRSRMARARTP